MPTIIFENDGVSHIGLLTGDGAALCGYVPEGWVGLSGPSDPETIEAEFDHPCGTCLRSLKSRSEVLR